MISLFIRIERFLDCRILKSDQKTTIADISQDDRRIIINNLRDEDIAKIRATNKEFREIAKDEVTKRNADLVEWLNSHIDKEYELQEYPNSPRTTKISKIDSTNSWRIQLNNVFRGHILKPTEEERGFEITFISRHELNQGRPYHFYVINIASGINSVSNLLNTIDETQWGGHSPGSHAQDGSLSPEITFKVDVEHTTWPAVNADILGEISNNFTQSVKDMLYALVNIETHIDNITDPKILTEKDDNHIHIQICFTYTRPADKSLQVKGSLHFKSNCCQTAWFWIDFKETASQGFKYRRQINDASIFEDLLGTDWSNIHALDTYYNNTYP